MTTIVTRAGKGSPLTHTEVDTNFTNLNTNKLETAAIPLGTLAAPSISFLSDANTGIYSPAADTLAFVTAGSNRVHITSGGLVGIGSSSPHATLQVHDGSFVMSKPATGSERNWRILGADTTAGDLSFSQSTTAGGSTYATKVTFGATGNVGIGTTSPGSRLTCVTATEGDVALALETPASNGILQLRPDGTNGHAIRMVGGGAQAGTLRFVIAGDVERARIDSSGRLLVGTIASPAHQLQVSTDSAGKPSTNTWTIVSDERIKEEIELADLDLCYQAVKNIPLKRFKWKDEVYTEEQVRDRRKLGWIAQDVEAVFPKAVGTYEFKYNQVFEETTIPAIEEVLDDEGNVTTPAQPERIEKGELISEDVIEDCRDLNSDQLYAAMYGAIQKLMIKVETLEIELALLKAQ